MLRDVRENAGLTQKELEQRLGKPGNYLSRVERGLLPPMSKADHYSLADVLGCDAEELWDAAARERVRALDPEILEHFVSKMQSIDGFMLVEPAMKLVQQLYDLEEIVCVSDDVGPVEMLSKSLFFCRTVMDYELGVGPSQEEMDGMGNLRAVLRHLYGLSHEEIFRKLHAVRLLLPEQEK